MTVEGNARSTVPSLSFCSSSLSPPSWLEPYTWTFALPPSLALARLANSSAEAANSEPGSPTWPNLISVWAQTLPVKAATSAAAMLARSFISSSSFVGTSGCGALWLRVALGKIRHGRLHAVFLHRNAGQRKAHFDPCEAAEQGEIVEVAQVADAEYLAGELAQPRAERHVEGLQGQLADPVGVVPRGQQHRRKRGRVLA